MRLDELLNQLDEKKLVKKQEKTVVEEMVTFVTFRVGQREFAIDIERASKVIKITNVTVVPNVPIYIKGVTNLRGEIIPILNILERFSPPVGEAEIASKFKLVEEIYPEKMKDFQSEKILQTKSKGKNAIVVKVGSTYAALLIDEILRTLNVPVSSVSSNPLVDIEMNQNYVKGMIRRGEGEKDLTLILNLEQLIGA